MDESENTFPMDPSWSSFARSQPTISDDGRSRALGICPIARCGLWAADEKLSGYTSRHLSLRIPYLHLGAPGTGGGP
jgi:hypothetical protein